MVTSVFIKPFLTYQAVLGSCSHFYFRYFVMGTQEKKKKKKKIISRSYEIDLSMTCKTTVQVMQPFLGDSLKGMPVHPLILDTSC